MLTEQQKLFVNEYLKLRCKNATQAAKNAGYSEKSASAQASQLLKNPKVLEFLKERKAEISQDLRQEFVFDALEARKIMYNIMISENSKDSDRLTAVRDFLDRAGFKATDKVEISTEETSLNKLGSILEQLKK